MESYANTAVLIYRQPHSPWYLPSTVGQFHRSNVPSVSHSFVWATVRLYSEYKSSPHSGTTTPLGWWSSCALGRLLLWIARKIQILDSECLSATAFVNWTSYCLMADSSMHSRAVSLSLNRSYSVSCTIGRSETHRRFRRGILNIRLCRVCAVRVSVFVMGVCYRYPVNQRR